VPSFGQGSKGTIVKTHRFISAAVLATLLVPAHAGAQSGYDAETFRRFFEGLSSPRLNEVFGTSKTGVIAMEGEATVRARPDAVQLRIGVTAQAASPTEASSENAQRMNAVLDALKAAIGEPALARGDAELRTATVRLSPVYAQPRDGSQAPRIEAYRATNAVTVTIRNFTQRDQSFVGTLIEKTTQAGANEIAGPHFVIEKDAKPLTEARVNAVDDARTKAETYAKALGVKLGRVLIITETGGEHAPMMMARSDAAASAASPVEPGTNEIKSRVRVVWEIRQE
jgi:uncharacterized protein